MWSRIRVPLWQGVAFLEAMSWLGLLSGMYVKYLGSGAQGGVHLFGSIHGGVFTAYVVLTLLTARTQRWTWRTTLLGLAASVPPFLTVVFEVWAQRTGRLDAAAARSVVG